MIDQLIFFGFGASCIGMFVHLKREIDKEIESYDHND